MKQDNEKKKSVQCEACGVVIHLRDLFLNIKPEVLSMCHLIVFVQFHNPTFG